jgi:hypothetical protein
MKNAFGIIFAFMLFAATAQAKVTCPVPDPPKPDPTYSATASASASASAKQKQQQYQQQKQAQGQQQKIDNAGNNVGNGSASLNFSDQDRLQGIPLLQAELAGFTGGGFDQNVLNYNGRLYHIKGLNVCTPYDEIELPPLVEESGHWVIWPFWYSHVTYQNYMTRLDKDYGPYYGDDSVCLDLSFELGGSTNGLQVGGNGIGGGSNGVGAGGATIGHSRSVNDPEGLIKIVKRKKGTPPEPLIMDMPKDPVTPKEVSDALHKYIIDIEVNVHQDPPPEAKVITKVVKVCPVVRHKKGKKKSACGGAVQAGKK